MNATLLDYSKYLIALSILLSLVAIIVGTAGYLTLFGTIPLSSLHDGSRALFAFGIFLLVWFLADYTRSR